MLIQQLPIMGGLQPTWVIRQFERKRNCKRTLIVGISGAITRRQAGATRHILSRCGGDLLTFSSFLKLCAGRTAQEINLSALGDDAGVSHNTAKSWLSILEASYIIHRMPAWHVNIRKQIVKAPKLHFLDTGLVCYLLQIREPGQLRLHPLRGAILESWVVSELYKGLAHQGEQPILHHYRENRGLEMDVTTRIIECNQIHWVNMNQQRDLTLTRFQGKFMLPQNRCGTVILPSNFQII